MEEGTEPGTSFVLATVEY